MKGSKLNLLALKALPNVMPFIFPLLPTVNIPLVPLYSQTPAPDVGLGLGPASY